MEIDDSEATLLQLDVDKSDDNKSKLEKGVAEISLYALLGSPSRGTMRMRGKINGHWITILIDIGSTHNFLDTAILVILQLSLDLTLTFEVKVANGATILTQGVCANVRISMQRHAFAVDLNSCP